MPGELKTYQAKRNFGETPEPKGKQTRSKTPGGRYLIQRHAATRLHYDFRIEVDGVLKSWAVTKAPSRDHTIKRVGTLSAGWPDRSDVAITTRKGSGLADALTVATNGLIGNGVYAKILDHWHLSEEALPKS